MVRLSISHDAWLELTNIHQGAFAPLEGFMNRTTYQSVVSAMHLPGGKVWPLPITLDVPPEQVSAAERSATLELVAPEGVVAAHLSVDDVFAVEPEKDVKQVFGTSSSRHPGVAKELGRSRFRVGGRIALKQAAPSFSKSWDLSPAQTRKHFKKKGWTSIVSFQTRNPPHRAHEYLQRVALEVSDGLFIQPLIGWKKPGDFMPEAVMGAYQIQVRQFFETQRVLLGALRTPMRYAGPREAVFHALIRKNHGCTVFIVGRDHAGVGNFYGKYEAQKLAKSLEPEMGITILPLAGPRFCRVCHAVNTERSCRHHGKNVVEISGTEIRNVLLRQQRPDPRFMRKEIARYLVGLQKKHRLFVPGNKE